MTPQIPASTPLITFGIPAYKRPDLLAETLASIVAQTASADYEIVVSDDGALLETQRLVQACSARSISYQVNSEPLGGVGNWNRCLQLARGKWVMILHEDDALYPWYLDLVLPRLREGIAAVCTKTVQGAAMPSIDRPTGKPGILPYPPRYFLKSAMTPFPGVVFPRELGLRLGGFSHELGALADYDFWYRLAAAGRVEVVREVAAFYRVSPGQWTERAWPVMLRRTHLLRLRIAREQFAATPRTGRWLARFFSYRSALAYRKRFPERPAVLQRILRFKRIPGSGLPSGWIWAWLKWTTPRNLDL